MPTINYNSHINIYNITIFELLFRRNTMAYNMIHGSANRFWETIIV
jgi:hypothetical protein